MSTLTNSIAAVAVAACAFSASAVADKRTVCTITVNSPDEQAALRRHLPERDYRFVELVEHGRSDWLESACRRQVRCDVLVVSGHFNGTDFYTTRLDVNDHLPVAEMERATCSASCPALFSQLREVYLFGCNSLNPEAGLSPAPEIERSLLRAGYSGADAARMSRDLGALHAESNREIMRRIFVDVPAIYGFSSTAPLGPLAASHIERWFRSGGGAAFGSGRADRRLLDAFAPSAMTAVAGMAASDARAAYRAQVCRFVDERQSPAQRLRFVHHVIDRGPAEARMFFERIEAFLASLDEAQKRHPDFVAALDEIANDRAARDRYLALARDTVNPAIRARMVDVAQALGWLTPDEHRAEIVRLVGDLLAQPSLSASDVDLVCSLNRDRAYDGERARLQGLAPSGGRIDRAAALACLGSERDHARMIAALTAASDDELRMAEVYFYRRPIGDPNEVRSVAAGIAAMARPEAQVRALDTLARLHVTDRDALEELVKLFPRTSSVAVQRAIAGILIRADYRAIASSATVAVLREHRLRSHDGQDAIDILLRRLQAAPS